MACPAGRIEIMTREEPPRTDPRSRGRSAPAQAASGRTFVGIVLNAASGGQIGDAGGARIAVRYAAALALAHVLATTAAVAIVIPLSWQRAKGGVFDIDTAELVSIAAIVTVGGTLAVAVSGLLNIAGALTWFLPAREPDPAQRRTAARLAVRQSKTLALSWAASGIVFVLANLDKGIAVAMLTVLGVVLGGSAEVVTALLLTQSTIRPIMIAAGRGSNGSVTVPGVLARLVMLWLLCCAIPFATIVSLMAIRSHGVIVARSASIEIPILVVSLAAVLVGLPAMILASRSISEPINEVADAMAKVQRGNTSEFVGVYERSEIGRLQAGFNRMVDGLAERDRVRDVFGRHVGIDVARRAIDEGVTMSGEVQQVAILFIDLVGSTPLAANNPPATVAALLNDFFRIVVRAVDEHDGVINKFQGDAALAVFGAPLRTRSPASQALATARALRTELRHLPVVDFGVGVSAGPVFAGNIGAEDRYEYTVIGDAVNEAARLADLAKTVPQRGLSSSQVIDQADDGERQLWVTRGSSILRGRAEATRIYTPTDSTVQAAPRHTASGAE